MTKSRGILPDRKRWTAEEATQLRLIYPHQSTILVAAAFGCRIAQVNSKARNLGLHKTEVYLASPAACRLRRGSHGGQAYQYPKGHVPANKGLRRPGYAPGRMAETQFKKGQRGNKWMAIGSERINADGYRDRKIHDTGYPPHDWRAVHILLWEEKNGPLPAKHCLSFRNKDKTDIRIENLELITRRERMLRNTIHNLPAPLGEVIMLKGALQRKINRRERREKQDGGSAQSPVRGAGRPRRSRQSAADRARESDLRRGSDADQFRQGRS